MVDSYTHKRHTGKKAHRHTGISSGSIPSRPPPLSKELLLLLFATVGLLQQITDLLGSPRTSYPRPHIHIHLHIYSFHQVAAALPSSFFTTIKIVPWAAAAPPPPHILTLILTYTHTNSQPASQIMMRQACLVALALLANSGVQAFVAPISPATQFSTRREAMTMTGVERNSNFGKLVGG